MMEGFEQQNSVPKTRIPAGQTVNIQAPDAPKPKKEKKAKTGGKTAKRVASAILAFAVFTGGFTAYHGAKQFRSDRRAKCLVESYTNEDGLCTLPEEVVVNKAYDIVYTSGSSLAKYLDKEEVKYCEILDQYYTVDGSDIAVLTFSTSAHIYEDATKVEFEGFTVYMAPEGYILEGSKCYKESNENIVKVVPRSATGDYSGYTIPGLENAEVVDVMETQTLPFSAIEDLTLICDVADGATLNESNECTAKLRLAQRK